MGVERIEGLGAPVGAELRVIAVGRDVDRMHGLAAGALARVPGGELGVGLGKPGVQLGRNRIHVHLHGAHPRFRADRLP